MEVEGGGGRLKGGFKQRSNCIPAPPPTNQPTNQHTNLPTYQSNNQAINMPNQQPTTGRREARAGAANTFSLNGAHMRTQDRMLDALRSYVIVAFTHGKKITYIPPPRRPQCFASMPTLNNRSWAGTDPRRQPCGLSSHQPT